MNPSNPTALSAEPKEIASQLTAWIGILDHSGSIDRYRAELLRQAAALILTLAEDRRRMDWLASHDFPRSIVFDREAAEWLVDDMDEDIPCSPRDAIDAAATPPTKAASGS